MSATVYPLGIEKFNTFAQWPLTFLFLQCSRAYVVAVIYQIATRQFEVVLRKPLDYYYYYYYCCLMIRFLLHMMYVTVSYRYFDLCLFWHLLEPFSHQKRCLQWMFVKRLL